MFKAPKPFSVVCLYLCCLLACVHALWLFTWTQPLIDATSMLPLCSRYRFACRSDETQCDRGPRPSWKGGRFPNMGPDNIYLKKNRIKIEYFLQIRNCRFCLLVKTAGSYERELHCKIYLIWLKAAQWCVCLKKFWEFVRSLEFPLSEGKPKLNIFIRRSCFCGFWVKDLKYKPWEAEFPSYKWTKVRNS